jgi:hypothetical protein
MNNSKFVTEISVTDPDTNNVIDIAIYKHENGGMFGVDSSYITQVLGDDESVPDVFSPGQSVLLNE